jgi:hypothetical protein
MLTPIVYTPEVKPKKSRIQLRAAGSVDETEETFEAARPGQPAPAGPKSPLQNFAPIEGAEQKPQQPPGRLSESTLKAMLQVQEVKQGG